MVLGLTTVLAACAGSQTTPAPAPGPVGGQAVAPGQNQTGGQAPNLDAAKKEGKLVIWHPDQEADVVQFLQKFTEKFGIQVESQRLLPGSALPKLETELKAGTSDMDVWWISDPGIMYDQTKKGRLMQYVSPEMKAYDPKFKSSPEGFYTTYYINVGPIMYNPKVVSKDQAPKTWADLLDPKWKGQLGMREAAAGTQYAQWYLLRDVLPKDYFDKLALNQPKAYNSSTQLVQDIMNGDTKIGGNVSIFQYTKAIRQNQPLEMVFPPEGVPSSLQMVGIMAGTKRPNAAKLFIDWFLSQEGQQLWNDIQGSYSARADVTIKELPKLTDLKLLTPQNMEDYASAARHEEFNKFWNQMTGLK
ncbi:MAG: hypothetical protein JWN15_3423 [Firmicutes bacterium]|nr:hypothetical protein [Bacillota bacterium]